MFWFKKKTKKEEMAEVAKEPQKEEKPVNLFDDWCIKHKHAFLKLRDIENKENPYAQELWELYEFGDYDYRRVLKKKNDLLKEEFIKENTSFCEDSVEWYKNEIYKCEGVLNCAYDIKSKQDYFLLCMGRLKKYFEKNQDEELKKLFYDYALYAEFKESNVLALKNQKYSFWEWVFNFIKILSARKYLDWFVDFFSNDNICKEAMKLFLTPYGMDIGYVLSLRLNTIVNYDYETSDVWVKKYNYELKKLNKRMMLIANDISVNSEKIGRGVRDCEISLLEDTEYEFVEKYFREKRENDFKDIQKELEDEENSFDGLEKELVLDKADEKVVRLVLDELEVGKEVVIDEIDVKGGAEVAKVLEDGLEDDNKEIKESIEAQKRSIKGLEVFDALDDRLRDVVYLENLREIEEFLGKKDNQDEELSGKEESENLAEKSVIDEKEEAFREELDEQSLGVVFEDEGKTAVEQGDNKESDLVKKDDVLEGEKQEVLLLTDGRINKVQSLENEDERKSVLDRDLDDVRLVKQAKLKDMEEGFVNLLNLDLNGGSLVEKENTLDFNEDEVLEKSSSKILSDEKSVGKEKDNKASKAELEDFDDKIDDDYLWILGGDFIKDFELEDKKSSEDENKE